jgi:hypothetical protein
MTPETKRFWLLLGRDVWQVVKVLVFLAFLGLGFWIEEAHPEVATWIGVLILVCAVLGLLALWLLDRWEQTHE